MHSSSRRSRRQTSPVIFVVEISGNQVDEAGIKRLPFPLVGGRMGHVTEALQLSLRPSAKPDRLFIRTPRQAFGVPDQVGQAGLSLPHVFLIHRPTLLPAKVMRWIWGAPIVFIFSFGCGIIKI